MAASAMQVERPMSVKEISATAQDYTFDPDIPLKFWLRTADILLREAKAYMRQGNYQHTYMLLMRYADLLSVRIPQHPASRDAVNKPAIKTSNRSIPDVIEKLESLKPILENRYRVWEQEIQRRRDVRASIGEGDSATQEADPAASDTAIAGNWATIAAAENKDLALELAHKEASRRRRVRRRNGASEEAEQERRTAGIWEDWEQALLQDGQTHEDPDAQMRRDMEDSRRRLNITNDTASNSGSRRLTRLQTPGQSPVTRSNSFHYPSISKPREMGEQRAISAQEQPFLPPKPPKERLEIDTMDTPPPVPTKDFHLPSPESPANILDPPPNWTFAPSSYLENGKPLRTVFLPQTLRSTFLKCAASNTRRNLETCGMLCGTLIANALFISQLVIPEQESTSDTCETVNESAFFDYCAEQDLMVLGWIHTHPTQTCFMSSRDLHTHCGYQIMMPESIAIVCAPTQSPNWGVFRLTDPPGMQSVLSCKKTGLFHPHEEDNIYTDALRPGHVMEVEKLGFQVVDLRP